MHYSGVSAMQGIMMGVLCTQDLLYNRISMDLL
jgi:hypothetical protein